MIRMARFGRLNRWATLLKVMRITVVRPMTLYEMAADMGWRDTKEVKKDLKRLIKMGYVRRGKSLHCAYRITERGMALLPGVLIWPGPYRVGALTPEGIRFPVSGGGQTVPGRPRIAHWAVKSR